MEIPIGCAGGYNSLSENEKRNFILHPRVNSETVFYSFNTGSGNPRKVFQQKVLKTDKPSPLTRSAVKSILDKKYTMTPLPPAEYFNNIGKYKFVISPEGNGIDCHRHYETWISKGIPIIEKNPFIEKKYATLPILWTTDYSEINNDYLEKIYPSFLEKEYDFRRLLLYAYGPATKQKILNVMHTQFPLFQGYSKYWKYKDYFR